ncbi:MAG: hypothetical protein ACOC1K_07240 [Nanoarchaeota archaeon]
MNNRELEEKIEHLRIDLDSEKEWNSIPESLKPTSKSRWDQMTNEKKTNVSRRLGM